MLSGYENPLKALLHVSAESRAAAEGAVVPSFYGQSLKAA